MRETKKVITPSGQEVEIYTYLTGKEARELQKVFFSHAKFEADATKQEGKFTGFDVTAVSDAEETALKYLVASVGEVREGAYKIVEDMRLEDYNIVVDAINEITKGVFERDFLTK